MIDKLYAWWRRVRVESTPRDPSVLFGRRNQDDEPHDPVDDSASLPINSPDRS